MANTVVANVGSFVSLFLAFMWTITLTRPWTWIWTDNAIVLFKVNLFQIHITKGTLGHVGTLVAYAIDKVSGGENRAVDSLNALFDQKYWMEEGVQELCSFGVESIWQWCNTWMMVKYGSMIFLFLGLVTVVFLAMGGSFLYYYAHHHPTHSGRKWIKACFVTAPTCAWLGLLQYVMLTFQLGESERKFVETHANYGAGFVMACTLTMLTLAPLYIIGVFAKVDDFEKHGESDLFLEENLADTATYGAAQGRGGGYPSAAPTGFQNYSSSTAPMQYSSGPSAYGASPPPPSSGVVAW